ncbi:hypothetical protein Tco_1218148 [Tanacetum coccineum]
MLSPPQSSNQPSIADNFQLDTGSTSTDNLIESLTNTLALLNQSYDKAYLPSNSQSTQTYLKRKEQCYKFRWQSVVHGCSRRPEQRWQSESVVKLEPIMCYNCKGNRAHSTRMSHNKASSGIRLLQRQDAAY